VTEADVEEKKNAICAYFAEQKDSSNFYHYDYLCYLAVCDGLLDEHETVVLAELANRLNIDEKTAINILTENVTKYLKPNQPEGSGSMIYGNMFQDSK
jgi:hypothetical protein